MAGSSTCAITAGSPGCCEGRETSWLLSRAHLQQGRRPAAAEALARSGAYGAETSYLRVYMAALRRKLEPNPSQPRYFRTDPGMGYRFEPGDSAFPGPAGAEASQDGG